MTHLTCIKPHLSVTPKKKKPEINNTISQSHPPREHQRSSHIGSSVTTAATVEAEAVSCYAQPRHSDHSALCPVSIVTTVSDHPAVIDHGRTEAPPSYSASRCPYKDPADIYCGLVSVPSQALKCLLKPQYL